MAGSLLEPCGALASHLVGELLGRHTPSVAPGTRLGPFRLLHELGRGGLGVVYLGERADDAFEQQVALKLIRPDRERDLTVTLLERERRILAKLRHPGIAHIVDGGCADGVIWFAMEYVEGERIDRYCRVHRLDGPARLRLLLKVGEAVAYAHARLVVHRDIKPANIVVDRSGEPRLLDFGIAAALDEAECDDPARRASTPGFASPEQCRGESRGIAADVYQLGRLLEILMRDVTVADRPGLDATLRRALDEHPENRYPNVEALLSDLRALLAHRPVGACAQRRGYRTALFLRRHRFGCALSFLAGVLFLATTIGFLWSLNAARLNEQREAATAKRTTEFMIGLFDNANPAVNLGVKPDIDALLARGRERIEHELAREPTVKGELLASLGRVHLALDDFANATSLLEEAVALGETDPDLPTEKLAMRKYLLAQAMLPVRSRMPDSHSPLDDALALISGRDDQAELRSDILREMDLAACMDGDIEESIVRLTTAIANARGTTKENFAAFARDLFNLGSLIRARGSNPEALPILREAYERTRSLLGDGHPTTVQYAAALASALAEAGEGVAANKLISDAVERIARLFGENSIRYAVVLGWQGEVAYWGDDLNAASAHFRTAIQIVDSLPDENDAFTVSLFERLGDTYMALGSPIKAEVAYRQMLTRAGEGRVGTGPDIGQRSLKMARALAELGRCEEAVVHFSHARERAAGFSSKYSIHAEFDKPLPGCPAEPELVRTSMRR